VCSSLVLHSSDDDLE